MKKTIITILFATVFFTCKDDNDEFLDDIAGKWTIDKITFKNLPNSSPDSSIACKNCFLEIDNCKLGNGGCDGRYQLMDGLLVNFRHSPSGLAQELFINLVKEPSSPPYSLNGPHKILERQKNSMKMSGKINLKPTPPNTLYKIVEIDMQLSK